MEIIYCESIGSTQTYLKEQIAKRDLKAPIALCAQSQTKGVGSRGSSWIGVDGNLFFSFALFKESLPQDLPLQSASIYFSYLFKEVLANFGSQVLLKWPNDFYIQNKKIGGTVTHLVSDTIVCGIGLNLVFVDEAFGKLDIDVSKEALFESYFKGIKNCPSWKDVFSKYSVEFDSNRRLNTHHREKKISLESAILNEDGSLTIDGERVLSLR